MEWEATKKNHKEIMGREGKKKIIEREVGKEGEKKNHWEGWQSEKKNQTTTMGAWS
jgi:hypothetical protein